MRPYFHSFVLVFVGLTQSSSFAQTPPIRNGTDAARKEMAAFRYPAGLKVELFACEPMLASPVAICLDEKGRVFVAEEYRFNQGTEENRTRPFLLEDDLQLRTVDDRLAMYKKHADKFPGGMSWFSKHSDQVRMLVDRAGTGHADYSTVFAGGFNDPLDGLAAGVLARDGNLYFTCIPHLWLLKDTRGTGHADVRIPLHRGFGVDCAFLGHDLHGLTWGPDGKLYFSVGDRGFNVTSKEGKTFVGPRTGGVFRCNPDGSELELIFRGLRNPQGLAFDQYGNLFADDNNCDKGDDSRLVYIAEGGDAGWNMAYQTIPEPYLTGPWHAERMWHLYHKGQPAWIVPPVGKIGTGPSGFEFTSGISLPPRYHNRFFMCNYTGNGGVESFGVVNKGAGFEIVDYHDFLKPIHATDVKMGYDGKLYVSDFVDLLWNGGTAGGRIYTVLDPERVKSLQVQDVQSLFKTGISRLARNSDLAELMAYPDLRVRQRAQFALAERGAKSIAVLNEVLAHGFRHPEWNTEQLGRMHAIWGLGQIGRHAPEALKKLLPFLKDPDVEIRAQVLRILGDDHFRGAEDEFVGLLKDESPRVRYFAAMGLGKLKHRAAVDGLFAMLEQNHDDDPFLRHVGIYALAQIGDAEAVQARAKHPSPSVRVAVLLIQRRLQDKRISQFLNDSELDIVTEAARAIHDLPLDSELPALAAALDRFAGRMESEAEPLLRRIIDAHFRLGQAENARALARYVANDAGSPRMRSEALSALADWTEPSPRDRVTWFWRPLAKRDQQIIKQVLEESIGTILSRTSGQPQIQAVNLITKNQIKADDGTFFRWLTDPQRDGPARLAALRLLVSRKFPQLDLAIGLCMKDSDPHVRAEARQALAGLHPELATPLLAEALCRPQSAVVEKQQALATLARMRAEPARKLLEAWAARLAKGEAPLELQLDLLEALGQVPGDPFKQAIQKFQSRQSPSDPLAKFRVSLYGGDAERGRQLFVGHSVAQCIRCHKIDGQGGDAGPDLSKVAERNPKNTREYLLESMIFPNAKIAPGYGSVTLTLTNGKVVAGIVKSDTEQAVVLLGSDGKEVTVRTKDIEERTAPTSAMPEMGRALSLRELRDLVEFLAARK
ncbi:MAG TPA: HEAT repeat domain-containing protein [Gemmataceae bacterium]|nr:HEAT repeat domain-containing protein [Gemmataceae bacterium]